MRQHQLIAGYRLQVQFSFMREYVALLTEFAALGPPQITDEIGLRETAAATWTARALGARAAQSPQHLQLATFAMPSRHPRLYVVMYRVVGFGRGDGRHSGRHRRSEV